MNNTELNQFILHYLKEDKTKSAIMLNADWGTGKSYYIQNELIPFLGKEENGSYSCIVVSLYGLRTLDDISKSLYIESRLKFFATNSEKIQIGKFAVKTVVKGVASFLGVDLSKSEEELQELYQSIDLSGKLIIFEDIERTKINILEILGYVNNLIEQDNIKVLLVTNEDEILKYNYSKPDEHGRTFRTTDEATKKYLQTKEKTVSDTISYKGDINSAISNIISFFNNATLNKFVKEDKITEIATFMESQKNYNLRSFLFACQKISDIFSKLSIMEEDFEQTIFFSVVAFSLRIKSGYFPNWDGSELISTELGSKQFPLYRFCYDYIRWQEFDCDKVQAAFKAHKKLKLYDLYGESIYDKDLNVLFGYHRYPECDVLTALNNIERRLDNSEDIPIYSYSKLTFYLIVCHTILNFDYTLCKEKMVSNMQQHGKEIDPEILFINRFEFNNEDEKQQFMNFTESLKDAVDLSNCKIPIFSYEPKDICSFYYDNVIKNEAKMTAGHTFISKFDLEKLVEMLFNCTSAQLDDWRGVMFAIYRHSTKADFLEKDRFFMEELIEKINELLSEKKGTIDRIVLLQINFLIDNMKTFVKQLS